MVPASNISLYCVEIRCKCRWSIEYTGGYVEMYDRDVHVIDDDDVVVYSQYRYKQTQS